jgi:uncharacterized protein
MSQQMERTVQHPVWLLPGWQDSGAGHWQAHWAEHFGDRRIEQHDWQTPLRGDWIMRLQECVLAQAEPVLLVAHSLGCHLVAAWAAASDQTHKVHAALLVAPPDCTRTDFPAALHSWRQPVLQTLPFASAVLASSSDTYASVLASEHLASAWGASFADMGALGHMNAESALGGFSAARRELSKLEQRAASMAVPSATKNR